VVKGARNGIVYGCKVRFPHALVMAALFSHKPWPTRIHGILSATRAHALALAKFVSIYKVLLIVQRRLNGGIERDLDTFIAGGIGGWFVFGERTPVSHKSVQVGESDGVCSGCRHHARERRNCWRCWVVVGCRSVISGSSWAGAIHPGTLLGRRRLHFCMHARMYTPRPIKQLHRCCRVQMQSECAP
jgi:hypothetical protein